MHNKAQVTRMLSRNAKDLRQFGDNGGGLTFSPSFSGVGIGFLGYVDFSYTSEITRTTWSDLGNGIKNWVDQLKEKFGSDVVSIDVDQFIEYLNTQRTQLEQSRKSEEQKKKEEDQKQK